MRRRTRGGHDISIQCGPARCWITRWRRVLRIGHSQRAESLAPRYHPHGIYFTRIPGQITVSWGLFVREQTVRSGGASGSSPPGCSSSSIHRIDTLHHANNSLATLLSFFIGALFVDEAPPSELTNNRLTGGENQGLWRGLCSGKCSLEHSAKSEIGEGVF